MTGRPSNIWVAPTEPPMLRAMGNVTSMLPEKFGVDVLWVSKRQGGMCGVQRKEIKDLVASAADGRLAKEVKQMQHLKVKVVMVEGRPRWSMDGVLMVDQWTRWDIVSHRNLLRSLQMKGIWVEATDDVNDTMGAVLSMQKWLEKERHTALETRPKPVGTWGSVNNRDWGIHLLQSFDGIGAVQAAAIYDHFGKVPMRWEVDAKELMQVKGIGKIRAQTMVTALERIEGEAGAG